VQKKTDKNADENFIVAPKFIFKIVKVHGTLTLVKDNPFSVYVREDVGCALRMFAIQFVKQLEITFKLSTERISTLMDDATIFWPVAKECKTLRLKYS